MFTLSGTKGLHFYYVMGKIREQIMQHTYLVIHIPVIHKGYIDFFEKIKGRISATYVIDEKFLEELSEFKPDIASMSANTVKSLLEKLGFKNIVILTKDNIGELENHEIILVQDEVSRNLCDKYLKGQHVEWQSVFLRWDKSKVLAQQNVEDITTSKEPFDIEMMKMAKGESEKSSDWWRQVGGVLVKDKKIVLRAENRNLPSVHTPYQVGAARDLFKAGEHHELANTIHAEEYIIAQAAKEGISTQGLSLYVTTFPCPVCAKLIAYCGIKSLYFSEGGSNFDAKKVLEAAGVKITHVLAFDIKPVL